MKIYDVFSPDKLLYSENGERGSGVAVRVAVRVAGGGQRVYLREDQK